MSKRTNNRFVVGTKPIESAQPSRYRKCAHHIYSHYYAANMRKHDEIMGKTKDLLSLVDMNSNIVIKIVFHFLAPKGSYYRDKVLSRIHDVIMSLNDDFNNYTSNPNTMNNFKYKSIINQVFISNMSKQHIYLHADYLKFLPVSPSNITFELGEIYYYPIKKRLGLGQYNDVKDIEIEQQLIRQYIHQSRADAIDSDSLLNIWIIDMVETSVLGFSNFPWEMNDNYHGIVINRRCFFPEDYDEAHFHQSKTITHQVGHFFGLLHVFNNCSGVGAYTASNINADSERIDDNGYITNVPDSLEEIYDPTDKFGNQKLHTDCQYNPLFMNFMDYTHDKYVCMFTQNQIQKMRYMLLTYRPKMNYENNKIRLPIPKYNPDTNTLMGETIVQSSRKPPLIPSQENVCNPRQVPQAPQTPAPDKCPPNNGATLDPYNSPHAYPPIPNQEQSQQNNSRRISQLVPNLSVNNLPNTTTNSQDQIIENIQNNFPTAEEVAIEKEYSFQDKLNDYQSYNSTDGYATSYPYDPYTLQEFQNNANLLQRESMSMPSVSYSNTPSSILQQQQSSIPTNYPPYDPRMQQQQSYDPRIPPHQSYDPRMPPQQPYDPRMQPQQSYPPYHHPYHYSQQQQPYQHYPQQQPPQPYQQPPQQYQQPPQSSCVTVEEKKKPIINHDEIIGKSNSGQKRCDPQFRKIDESKRRAQKEFNADVEIDVNAVKSLRSHKNTDQQRIPLSNTTDKINIIDEQIQSIKSKLSNKPQTSLSATIAHPVPISQPSVPQPTSSQPKPKQNKANPTVSKFYKPSVSSGNNTTRTSRRKFTRTKPLNVK